MVKRASEEVKGGREREVRDERRKGRRGERGKG